MLFIIHDFLTPNILYSFSFKPRYSLFIIQLPCPTFSDYRPYKNSDYSICTKRVQRLNEAEYIQTYVQSVSNKSTYLSTEYSLFRQGDCVAPLRLKDANAGERWTVTNSSQGPIGFINHAEGRNDGLWERVLVLLGLINCRSFKSKILF